jgi:hypothetical protein
MAEFEDINIDLSKRTPAEWSDIYHLKLYNSPPRQLWTEFEWAYNLPNLDYQYILINDSSEEAEEMELRAFDIKNLIFHLADKSEKEILKTKYIETEWIRKKLIVNDF